MTLFAEAKDCSLFLKDFEILKLPPLPHQVEFTRGPVFWQFTYRHKTFTAAIHREFGFLLGFNGPIYPGKRADLLVLRMPGFLQFEIHERRFTANEGELAARLERLATAEDVRPPASAIPEINLYSQPRDPFQAYQRPLNAIGGIISGVFGG